MRIAVCCQSVQWPMCHSPIWPLATSAFSRVARLPTPNIPPLTAKVVGDSTWADIWTSLEKMRGFRAANAANNAPGPAHRRPPRLAKWSAALIRLRPWRPRRCPTLCEAAGTPLMRDTANPNAVLHRTQLHGWSSRTEFSGFDTAQFESAKAHYKWGDGPLVTTDKKCLSHYSRLGEAARAHHRWCGVDRGVDARLRRVGAQECPMLAKLSLIVAGDVAGHPLMRQRSRLLCSVCARTRACGDTGDNVMPGRFG